MKKRGKTWFLKNATVLEDRGRHRGISGKKVVEEYKGIYSMQIHE